MRRFTPYFAALSLTLPTLPFPTLPFPTLAVLTLAAGLTGCEKRSAHHTGSADAGEGVRFLARNAKEAGVVTLPSGLEYKVVRSAAAGAPSPKTGDEIKINYEGTLIDGTVFDSTYRNGQPAVMPLEGLVPGWMEALPRMHVGDVWYLYLPPRLGYGPRGAGGVIPPDAVLVFKIELLGVLPAQGAHNA